MSSGLRLALLTLNLTQNDFDRIDRDKLKKYIENFFKQEYVQKDFEKYKIAAKLVLENKPKPIIEEENIYDDVVNVEEENRSVRHHRRNENQHSRNTLFNPLSIFNNHFSNMMNEIDNLHRNMINSYNNTNGYTKSYSRTYVNNNGTGYIKEESIENDGKGEPKVKSFYKKIENGKYVEDPSRSSQKMIEQ
jgi:anti-sigma28 factor (negative regulator of flagellin synthesis)